MGKLLIRRVVIRNRTLASLTTILIKTEMVRVKTRKLILRQRTKKATLHLATKQRLLTQPWIAKRRRR